MLERSSHNPILKAQPHLSWCNIKIYNSAVYSGGFSYKLLFRGIGEDWISRIGLAESADGERFVIDQLPVISPEFEFEKSGVEDPRLVKIDGKYYVTYTAFDGKTARAAIVSSIDFKNWVDKRLIFPKWNTDQQRENLPSDWSKAAAMFPEKIGSKYYLFFGDNHIWPAISDNLYDWDSMYEPILSARPGKFDSAYIEMGPPPIKTKDGWLVLYHGIDSFGDDKTYRLGAALFDLDNPLIIKWRCDNPILEPKESYEVAGLIDVIDGGYEVLQKLNPSDIQQLAVSHQLPSAVFCCGAVRLKDKIRLYYSGSDTVLCTAIIDLDTILKS